MKFKSIKQTTYQNEDSIHKDVVQIIYGVRGNDSLEFENGVLRFTYIAKFDEKVKISQLARYNINNGEQDEWHTYKYNPDGSYSIEIIAQGARTVYSGKYDKANLLKEEVNEFGTIVYQRNASGKVEKIFFTEEHKNTEVIAVYYYNEKEIILNEIRIKESKAMYFRYNDKGLINEMRMVIHEENGKKQSQTTLFEYEFYDS